MSYTLRGFGEMLAMRSLLVGSKIALPSGSHFHVVGRDLTVMHRTIDHLTMADLIRDKNVFEYPGLRDVVVLESSAVCKLRRSVEAEVLDGTGRVETLAADTVINAFGSTETGSMPTGGGWVYVAYIAPGSTYAFVDVTQTPTCGENEMLDPTTGRCEPVETPVAPPPVEPPVVPPPVGSACTTDAGLPGHFAVKADGTPYCNPDPHPSKWYTDRRLWIAVGGVAGAGLLYVGYRWYRGRRK